MKFLVTYLVEIRGTANPSTMVKYIQMRAHVLSSTNLCGFLCLSLQQASLLAGPYYKIPPIHLYSWNWCLKLESKDVHAVTIQSCTVNYKY